MLSRSNSSRIDRLRCTYFIARILVETGDDRVELVAYVSRREKLVETLSEISAGILESVDAIDINFLYL